jgi:AcrR family transcriptional regulator
MVPTTEGSPGKRKGRAGQSDAASSRSAVTREALLHAARELFTERGYSATKMADIVEKAGASVGLPYYYFGSKEKIFTALWSDYQAKQEARTRLATTAARAAGETDRGRLLVAGMRAYLEGAWEARDLLPMMHGHDRPPRFDAVMKETNLRWAKRNMALLVGETPLVANAINAVLSSSLGAMCTELVNCRNYDEAKTLIDISADLWTAMIDRIDALHELADRP